MLLAVSAAAQTKIATVDMEKILKNYWKTQQVSALIETNRLLLQKDDQSMRDDFKKDSDEYQKLLDSANDQALSADEREKNRLAADAKLKQLQDHENAINQYERQAQATLADKQQQAEQNLFKDIQKQVADRAKAGGYTLVVNTAAQTIIVYSADDNDLTDDVIKQLNAGAPIDMTKPASTTATPPALNSLGNP